jgi:hypothetical protein
MRQSRMLALCAVVVFGSLPARRNADQPGGSRRSRRRERHRLRRSRVGALCCEIQVTTDVPEPGEGVSSSIFTAVIFGSDRPKFGEPQKIFQGKLSA